MHGFIISNLVNRNGKGWNEVGAVKFWKLKMMDAHV